MRFVFLFIMSCALQGCFLDDKTSSITNERAQAITVVADSLDASDKQQLIQCLKDGHIQLAEELELEGYRVEVIRLEHHIRDLYSNQSEHLQYLNLLTELEVAFYDRQRGEPLWHKVFHHESRFIPNEHFYADKNWAEAKMCYDHQRNVFSQLMKMIKQTY